MVIRGEEQMSRGNITATLLWESVEGHRKPLVFGSLNGSKKKPKQESVAGLRPESRGDTGPRTLRSGDPWRHGYE